ncbi:F-box protein CPR1, partial [Bienertia sinuspersici]
YASTRHFMLLNPSTGKYWEIPSAKLQGIQPVLNIEFGYDSENGDYEILEGNFWRWVDKGTRIVDSIQRNPSVVVLGNHLLHYIIHYCSGNRKRIACFDIRSETWRDDVMMPKYYDGYDWYENEVFLHDLGVFEGFLCSTFENRRQSNFDVWIMKEYGVNESWMKLFSMSISNVPGKIYPIAFRKGSNDEVLLRVNYPTKVQIQ